MKYKPGESLEDWSKRVQLFEYGLALQELAQGKDIKQIMENMAKRISNKMMHPVVTGLIHGELSEDTKRELEISKERYQREYIDRFAVKPDHILDDVVPKQQFGK